MSPRARLARAEVGPLSEPLRLDAFVYRALEQFPSRASARKAIKRGEILLDGVAVESGRFVRQGQQVDLLEPDGPPPPRYRAAVDVIYEDPVMAVVVKPPGLRVNGPQLATLEHALPLHLSPSHAADALRWPRPAHRLDAPTGGLVVVGKTAAALAALSGSFAQRRVHKTYQALLVGRLEDSGEVLTPVRERTAHTSYRVLAHARALRSEWVTWVELRPHTGRQHQLRVHMASLGVPILGDARYGIEGLVLHGKGLFLWAVGLRLPHPVPHPLLPPEIVVQIDAPPKFDSLMAREARRWLKWRGDRPAGDAQR